MEAKRQPRRWGLRTLVGLGWALLLAFRRLDARRDAIMARHALQSLDLSRQHRARSSRLLRASRSLPGAAGRVGIAFGLGLTLWTLADIYWVVALEDLRRAPYPSLSDAGYLLALPCLFVGIAMLIERRIGRFTLASWFDGAIAALGAPLP